MKKTKSVVCAVLFYLAALLNISLYLFVQLHPRISMNPIGRLVLLGLFCVCLYFGSRCVCKIWNASKLKVMKWTFFVFFLLYLSLLLSFTLFDPYFGRIGSGRFIFSDRELLKLYLANSFNIIPFSTIFGVFKDFFAGNIMLSTFITNIFGNLVAFMPMALFLPLFFRRCGKPIFFTVCVSLSVLAVELLQFVLVTGSCDIDDLILNVSGAVIMYLILKTKPMSAVIDSVLMRTKD